MSDMIESTMLIYTDFLVFIDKMLAWSINVMYVRLPPYHWNTVSEIWGILKQPGIALCFLRFAKAFTH